MASRKKKKPGIGRISKPRRIKSYVGPDVEKAMEAVGIPVEVKVDGTQAALATIAAQLVLLVAAAEKLVAKADAPARQPRKAKETATSESEAQLPLPTPGAVEKSPLPPPPTLDDLRAAAVAYAGKHGKEQLVALLQKYNPEGKLSTIPEKELSPCLAALKVGMVD